MEPICPVCFCAFDLDDAPPTELVGPPVALACGHVICCDCIPGLINNDHCCPLRCSRDNITEDSLEPVMLSLASYVEVSVGDIQWKADEIASTELLALEASSWNLELEIKHHEQLVANQAQRIERGHLQLKKNVDDANLQYLTLRSSYNELERAMQLLEIESRRFHATTVKIEKLKDMLPQNKTASVSRKRLRSRSITAAECEHLSIKRCKSLIQE